ncbi:hypothetical protein KUTeg_016390 [Tegillarca granosa]|uniref:SRCR domain-containing protein n=1 Tax=Tegillarca granosa TaxID=220873 RepID=A0ABQ9EQK4_TEGGR|nr:hypothetical protein KUTeg_016390 [Tegillarca granosa]
MATLGHIDPDGRLIMFSHFSMVVGSVCSSKWGIEDAEVVCRQLGFPGVVSFFTLPRSKQYDRAVFGLHCTGTERFVEECPLDTSDFSGICSTMDDAAVTCGQPNGRVMMISHSNGYIGTVCSSGWNKEDADVICRQQGFPGAVSYFTLPRSIQYVRTIFGIHCSGTEKTVEECPVDTIDYNGMCSSMEDAAVSCSQSASLGHIEPDGRVIMISHSNGYMGTMCASAWDKEDADIICRQQGFPGAVSFFTLPRTSHFDRAVFGIHCTGFEKAVEECSFDTWDVSGTCGTMEDAAVDCGQSASIDIFLGDQNRILVFDQSTNQVGTICANGWDNNDAMVFCRYMGFPNGGIATYTHRNYNYTRIAYNVRCLGNETNIKDCSKDDASLGHIEPDGRVMMISHSNGYIGTVCSSGWNQENADVICRQQGFPGAVSYFTLPRSIQYVRTIFGIHCSGTEKTVEECPVDTIDYNGMCSSMEDAAVSCSQSARH